MTDRCRTLGEIHDTELTTAPCHQSVDNPVENPVMSAAQTNDTESTGSCG